MLTTKLTRLEKQLAACQKVLDVLAMERDNAKNDLSKRIEQITTLSFKCEHLEAELNEYKKLEHACGNCEDNKRLKHSLAENQLVTDMIAKERDAYRTELEAYRKRDKLPYDTNMHTSLEQVAAPTNEVRNLRIVECDIVGTAAILALSGALIPHGGQVDTEKGLQQRGMITRIEKIGDRSTEDTVPKE